MSKTKFDAASQGFITSLHTISDSFVTSFSCVIKGHTTVTKLGTPFIRLEKALSKLGTPTIQIEIVESGGNTTAILGKAILGMAVLGNGESLPKLNAPVIRLETVGDVAKLETPVVRLEIIEEIKKLNTPVIRLDVVSDQEPVVVKLGTPSIRLEDTEPILPEEMTPSILGVAVLGRTILGVGGDALPKLNTPVIRLQTITDELPKLGTPTIKLEVIVDKQKLATPIIRVETVDDEPIIPKLATPIIELEIIEDEPVMPDEPEPPVIVKLMTPTIHIEVVEDEPIVPEPEPPVIVKLATPQIRIEVIEDEQPEPDVPIEPEIPKLIAPVIRIEEVLPPKLATPVIKYGFDKPVATLNGDILTFTEVDGVDSYTLLGNKGNGLLYSIDFTRPGRELLFNVREALIDFGWEESGEYELEVSASANIQGKRVSSYSNRVVYTLVND